jgi:hypothetical protein
MLQKLSDWLNDHEGAIILIALAAATLPIIVKFFVPA